MSEELRLEHIAKIIGYHFWKCASNEEAIRMGTDCAKEIIKEIEEE